VGTDEITLRSLIPSVFFPIAVYETGNGAVAPILALTALNLGASPAVAGLIVALLGLGQLVGNLPAATLVNRLGDRRALVASAAVAGAAMVVSYFAADLLMLAAATFVVGACNATFYLARQTFITLAVPASLRATVMSTVGGTHRLGLMAGPFLGAAVIHATHLRAAFLVAAAALALTVLLLLVVPEPGHALAQRPREPGSIVTVWREHRRLLLTLGIAVFGFSAVRTARPTVLPLWADQLGIDAQTTSVIFGAAAAVEAALFYPAGKAMDRYGRLSVALPCLVLLGGSLMLLPLTSSVAGLTTAALVMGFGNGIGSGVVMTLGADVAPRDAPVRFLSQWRVMGDCGSAGGPLLVSAAAAVAGLVAAVVVSGAVGIVAAAGIARWAPRYSPFATLAMVRARQH
jgi:MFS family permease